MECTRQQVPQLPRGTVGSIAKKFSENAEHTTTRLKASLASEEEARRAISPAKNEERSNRATTE